MVILWCTPYQECRVIYNALEQWGFVDRRIVVFNAARFAEYADDFWMLAEMVVQWREDRNTGMILLSYQHDLKQFEY